MPLGVVLLLVILKHIPGTEGWPLARLAGIASFGYAIFLSLRLLQAEDGVMVDGWSELRASPLELAMTFGAATFAVMTLNAVIFNGALAGSSAAQIAVAFALAAALAGLAAVVLYTSVLVRIRWSLGAIERRDARGRVVAIAWADVVKVRGRWNGITIYAADQRRLSFSPLQSGAAQLARFAQRRASRNAQPSGPVLWGQGG